MKEWQPIRGILCDNDGVKASYILSIICDKLWSLFEGVVAIKSVILISYDTV